MRVKLVKILLASNRSYLLNYMIQYMKVDNQSQKMRKKNDHSSSRHHIYNEDIMGCMLGLVMFCCSLLKIIYTEL